MSSFPMKKTLRPSMEYLSKFLPDKHTLLLVLLEEESPPLCASASVSMMFPQETFTLTVSLLLFKGSQLLLFSSWWKIDPNFNQLQANLFERWPKQALERRSESFLKILFCSTTQFIIILLMEILMQLKSRLRLLLLLLESMIEFSPFPKASSPLLPFLFFWDKFFQPKSIFFRLPNQSWWKRTKTQWRRKTEGGDCKNPPQGS